MLSGCKNIVFQKYIHKKHLNIYQSRIIMKKLSILLLACCLFVANIARADEGMWLLPLIEKLNIKDMKAKGLKLTAEQIYSINKTSMKDAVVIFGGGCTGELISNQGLLLTNHHCGYGAIQQHSSVEHDYLRDGFWAHSQSEEIPTPGLSVVFLDSIADVTSQIVPALSAISDENKRQEKVAELSQNIVKALNKDTQKFRTLVMPLYGGNTYYLFVYKVYNDVRMVGAPPSSIGKFGADTDNWMWPRQTGDFSLFRIYADKDGNPADYSPTNVPFKPKHYFPISLKGVQEGDFAMVMGYPGSTQRYMTSWEVLERINNSNEPRIKIRGVRQELMMEDMLADQKVRIQYSSKYAGSSNYWKNSIGMNKALAKLKVVDRKREQEAAFTAWVNADPKRKQEYGETLELIRKAVEGREQPSYAMLYLTECISRGSEIVGFAQSFVRYYEAVKRETKTPQDSMLIASFPKLMEQAADKFFKDYSMPTDKKISKAMFKLYAEDIDRADRPDIFQFIKKEYKNDFAKFVDDMFATSFMTNPDKVAEFIKNPSVEKLEADLAFKVALSAYNKANELRKAAEPYSNMFSKGFRQYMAGLMAMNPNKPAYPDANFTMRLTYGSVKGYEPADAVYYNYLTTLKGVMEKEDPNNWEFVVPEKLKELYAKKDFGMYADKSGKMPVNFIFNGDITGGNSGSPVINGKGELIGTAFDGNWEAMSGDIAFEPELQRCINVDIRYTLFIIDKFAGATRLINEMTIVK